MKSIIRKTGTNYLDKLDDPSKRDKIHSEKTFYSNILNIGFTPDMLIQHADGTYSLKDFKTGYYFNRQSRYRLKFFDGIDRHLYASPRDLAKLQISLYAFLMKLENPDIKFRDLDIVYIPSKNEIFKDDTRAHVDIHNYLAVIEQWLGANYPTELAQIKQLPHAKKLFNPKEYINVSYENVDHGSSDASAAAKFLMNKIASLDTYLKAEAEHLTEREKLDIKEQRKEYTRKLIPLVGDPDVKYSG